MLNHLVQPHLKRTPAGPDYSVTEQDLAIYAALSGRRPQIHVVEQSTPYVATGYLVPTDAAQGLRRIMGKLHLDKVVLDRLSRHRQKRVAVWLWRAATSARYHMDRAKVRLSRTMPSSQSDARQPVQADVRRAA